MEKPAASPRTTQPSLKGGISRLNPKKFDTTSQRDAFVVLALNMSWQLALAVLVPVIGGALLDRKTHTNTYVFVGLGVALVATAAVMVQTVRTANSLPVPKLTAAQRRAIKKAYEDEDNDQ